MAQEKGCALLERVSELVQCIIVVGCLMNIIRHCHRSNGRIIKDDCRDTYAHTPLSTHPCRSRGYAICPAAWFDLVRFGAAVIANGDGGIKIDWNQRQTQRRLVNRVSSGNDAVPLAREMKRKQFLSAKSSYRVMRGTGEHGWAQRVHNA